MKEFISILLLILGLLGGGILGYCLGTINMQEEAVIQGVAVFEQYHTGKTLVNYTSKEVSQETEVEFRWLPPCGR